MSMKMALGGLAIGVIAGVVISRKMRTAAPAGQLYEDAGSYTDRDIRDESTMDSETSASGQIAGPSARIDLSTDPRGARANTFFPRPAMGVPSDSYWRPSDRCFWSIRPS